MAVDDEIVQVESWLKHRPVGRVGEVKAHFNAGDAIDEWRVEAYLGSGLSAEVYRVVNIRYGQHGALKLLVDKSRGLEERFLAEADALKNLSLKSLPRYMGGGEYQGRAYYVMEHLLPLPDPMPRENVPRFMRKLAMAAHELHSAGYIHRDLKPGNVLCRLGGEPVVIDLGLIKRRGESVTDSIVRYGRQLSIIDGKPVGVGTHDFSAPEQLLNATFSVQSDIFSLGKIARSLYEGKVPRSMRPIVDKATRDRPEDRYESALEMAKAIKRIKYVRILQGILLAFVVSIFAAFPLYREPLKEMVKELVGYAPPETFKPSLVKIENELDIDYFNRILPLAAGGNVEAEIAVAEAYLFGRGVEIDKPKAYEWYKRAAEAGEASAMASIGYMHFRGIGCEENLLLAVEWYKKGAEKGDLGAMNDLAFCYINGRGVEKNKTLGFEIAMEAAKRGHAASQTMVGECYLGGIGVEKDVTKGETWLYRAARQENKRAQMLLETR